MTKVTWSTTARQNMTAIAHYISRHNPTASKAVARKIFKATNLLADYPEMGVRTKLDRVRRLIVPGSVYIIYYKFDDIVEILEIFDGRQEAPRNLPDNA